MGAWKRDWGIWIRETSGDVEEILVMEERAASEFDMMRIRAGRH